MIDRATLETELADYAKQRTEAQQQATVWQQRALLAEGAWQATTALLAKLDALTPKAEAAEAASSEHYKKGRP